MYDARLNDLPLDADFSAVVFTSYRKTGVVTNTTLENIVSSRGWSGSMDFETCQQRLKDCEFDSVTEEIFMQVGTRASDRTPVHVDARNVGSMQE